MNQNISILSLAENCFVFVFFCVCVFLGWKQANKLSFYLSCAQQTEKAQTFISCLCIAGCDLTNSTILTSCSHKDNLKQSEPQNRDAFSASVLPTHMQADRCHHPASLFFFSFCQHLMFLSIWDTYLHSEICWDSQLQIS